MSGPITLALGLLLAAAAAAASPSESAGEGGASDVVLVVDASGSMRAKMGGQTKMDIARRVLRDAVGSIPAGAQVGLVAYGHRSETDCADIETIVPIGGGDRAALLARVDALPAKGKTPITGALTQVFDGLAKRGRPATVVLVSDGIETCGGDPCKTVRDARARGLDLILHVVGFDVGTVDVSQLECAAQAGGGLYFGARDAKELGAALGQAVALTPDTPAGRVSVKTTTNGALADALLEVRKHGAGDVITALRTYKNASTNPRMITLPAGTYDLRATAVGVTGATEQRLPGVVVEVGKTAEYDVVFDSGILRVKVTRNGALSDTVIQVLRAGTTSELLTARAFDKPQSNPKEMPLPAGTYDVVIKSVELADRPTFRWDGVVVGTEPAERVHDFPSGTLRVGARHGSRPIEAVVEVADPAAKTATASARTHVPPAANATTFHLTPGAYRLTVTPIKQADGAKREIDVTIAAGGTGEQVVDFGAP